MPDVSSEVSLGETGSVAGVVAAIVADVVTSTAVESSFSSQKSMGYIFSQEYSPGPSSRNCDSFVGSVHVVSGVKRSAEARLPATTFRISAACLYERILALLGQ